MPEYKAITKVCKIYNCVCAYLNNEFTYYSHLYIFLLFSLPPFPSFFRLSPAVLGI